jgi:uncharacterized protein
MMRDLDDLLRHLRPTLRPGVYAFCTYPADRVPADLPVLMAFREVEGWTLILKDDVAAANNLVPLYRAAWIELGVESDLAAVGLLAAVTTALAAAGISCNVVSAVRHDHLFVPADRGVEAVAVLERLVERASY